MTYKPKPRYQGQVQAVILDWAGTTVDFGSCAPVLAVIEAFKRYGVEITRDEARAPMGMAKRDHIAAILEMPAIIGRWQLKHRRMPCGDDIDRIYQCFLPLQLEFLPKSSALIPGCLEAISACRQMGIKVGSTTGYTQELMDALVPLSAEQGFLPETIVTASDLSPGRPAPWLCLEAARRLNVFPMESIVVVDDTVVGVEAGLNAGMWAIGISETGNLVGLSEAEIGELSAERRKMLRDTAADRLKSAGAHLVIDSIAHLPQAIFQINSWLSSR